MFERVAGELRAKLLGRGAWPGFEARRRDTHQHASHRRCGGRRRVRRARAGFEIDHSERSSRVAISRAAGPDGARNTSGATQQQHGAWTASERPGPTAPGTPAVPHSNNTGPDGERAGRPRGGRRSVGGTSDNSRIYSPARRSTSCMMRPHTALTHATAATPRTRERQGRICRKSSKP